jgi:hypothetical protein
VAAPLVARRKFIGFPHSGEYRAIPFFDKTQKEWAKSHNRHI